MKNPKTIKRNYCIQTITHDYPGAGALLELVVDQFIQKTDITSSTGAKLDWFIRANGINKDLQATLEHLPKKYSNVINWHIFVGQNLGVGAGINFLNQKCVDYEYLLFIEGDWVITSEVNKDWLSSSLQILEENPEYEQVFLRRYYSDYEDRINGMSDYVNAKSFLGKVQKQGVDFLCLKEGLYTNNPSIRRQKEFFNRGFFPLNEYYDQEGKATEVKGTPDWGKAEIEARTSSLKTFYLWPGIFRHEGKPYYPLPKIPCTTCKYEFENAANWFCLSCSKDESFVDLLEHTNRAINTVLKFVESKEQNVQDLGVLTNFVKNVIQNPTKPSAELVEYYYGKS